MIKVNYDIATGEIKGFYPDDIEYAVIPEPYIEIDNAAHVDCITHNGLRRVDLATLTIVEYAHIKTATEINSDNNAQILSQITVLESSLLRPLRELNSTLVIDKSFAQEKVDSIEQQIRDLRAQLK